MKHFTWSHLGEQMVSKENMMMNSECTSDSMTVGQDQAGISSAGEGVEAGLRYLCKGWMSNQPKAARSKQISLSST